MKTSFILLVLILFSTKIFSSSTEDKNPKRREVEHSVLYYQGTYVPAHVSVFEGDDLVLHFGNFSGTPQCLWSKELDFFSSSYQGKLTTSVLKNLSPGSYRFSCPGSGKATADFLLTVIAKEVEEIDTEVDRQPSSVETYEWRPRDENDQYFGTESLNASNSERPSIEKNSRIQREMDSYENYFEGVN